MTRVAAQAWVPDRQDVIWIDCSPQAGHEMRDLHPLLVLSPKAFNAHESRDRLADEHRRLHRDQSVCRAGRDRRRAACRQGELRALPLAQVFGLACAPRQASPLKRLADLPFAPACGVLHQIVTLA